MQAAGLQCLKLQIAIASPGPQTSVFPGAELSRETRSPNIVHYEYIASAKVTPDLREAMLSLFEPRSFVAST